ncbi:MAG: hypothetical protein ACFFEN_14630 [Candidatus Thorarchaeota archaeon]
MNRSNQFTLRLFFLFITIGLSGLFFITFSNAFTQPSLSAENIEWGVSEGTKLVWIVDESNESLGYLPVNSRYELTIESISSSINGEGYPVDVIYATLLKYNSSDETSTTLLDNDPFILFNVSDYWYNTRFEIFSPAFLEHGFILPINYRNNLSHGLFNFLGDTGLFDSMSIGGLLGSISITGNFNSPNAHVLWFFNKNNVCRDTSIESNISDKVYYSTYLEGSRLQDKISFGNFYLIIAGFMILCIVSISFRKIKKT